MNFHGISRVFSTEGQQQYRTIGIFWQEMSEKHGRGNLRGLGYNWTAQTIEYVIGLKDGIIEGANRRVELPNSGWEIVRGQTDDLGKIYDAIYKDGALLYEIEMFTDDGTCEIQYYR